MTDYVQEQGIPPCSGSDGMPRNRARSFRNHIACWLAVYLCFEVTFTRSFRVTEAFVPPSCSVASTRNRSGGRRKPTSRGRGAFRPTPRESRVPTSFLPQPKVRDFKATASRDDRSFLSSLRDRDMSMTEMIAMNAVGGAMMVGVVYSLASTNLNGLLSGAASEDFGKVGFNIVDAAMPMTATDLVSGTLGEATAVIVASVVSLSLSVLPRLSNRRQDKSRNMQEVEKAVGNGDFLLAQATAMPLLQSVGLSPILATLGSVAFAAVPAELVKVASQKSRNKKLEEDRLFEQLLQEKQQKKQRKAILFFRENMLPSPAIVNEVQELIEKNQKDQKESLVVEVVSDIIKWLGYSALCADLAGQLRYNGLPLFPGLESAAFGVIATLSAQLYGDILYAYCGFGGQEQNDLVRSRTLLTWVVIYFSEAFYAAIFFGVYEFAQIPATAAISAFLSGGAEACNGSEEFDLCLQAFVSQNPPGASPEGQLRSLVTTLVSLWNQFPSM